MTIDDAIRIIKCIQPTKPTTMNGIMKKDALEIAIKELEQKHKRGHWIPHPQRVFPQLVCDNCLTAAPYNCETNYCPNCGLKMIEEGDDIK